MQELDILKIVLDRLNNSGVEYMLTGCIALNYYVQPRMTRDVDIVINISEADVQKVHELFKEDFYVDMEEIKEAIMMRSSFNIIYLDVPFKFDFIIRKDTPYRKLELERKQEIEIEGRKTFIVSMEDLIISKLFWAKDSGSQIQLNDARLILNRAEVDLAYIRQKTKELGIDTLLEEVLK